MAYVARPTDFQTNVSPRSTPAALAPTQKRPGLLRRLYKTIMENRQKSADRDIAALLARRGYRLTDSVEREIDAYYIKGGWQTRR
ncbi:MAG: hypothetical protein P8Z80_09090 [Pseudolabrys sp.]|jgi:hypothetical protein